jgi:sigma-54 specific flagellar transcriptional regulator A
MLPKKLQETFPKHPAQLQYCLDSKCSDVVDADENLANVMADASRLGLNPLEEIILIATGQRDFPVEGVPLKVHLSEFETKLISHALNHAGGNISKTAQLLNLQRTTLVQKLNKLKSRNSSFEYDLIRSMSSVSELQ